MPHVDVVHNKWLAGEQVPVARVFLIDRALKVECPDPDRWGSVVDRALAEVADRDPERALAMLSGVLSGSHLFATHDHDEQHCPFDSTWDAVRIDRVDVRSAVPAGG